VIRAGALLIAAAACGQAAPAGPDAFAPRPDPSIVALTPDHGPALRSTAITIHGTGFDPDDQVLLGGHLTRATTVDGETITLTVPPGLPGTVLPLIVFNQRGVARGDGFRYHAGPVIGDVSGPISGAGGATVTITGSGFFDDDAGPPAIFIAGQPVADVVVASDAAVSFTAPTIASPPLGRADLALQNANGAAVLIGGYRYTHPGLLTIGDRFLDNNQTAYLMYIDPAAAAPAPIQIAPIARYTVRGLAAVGDALWLIAPSPLDGLDELASLDPFAGTLTGVQPIHLADGTRIHVSGLFARDGLLFAASRICCPNQLSIYALDPATGVATQAGAAIALPTSHHKLAVAATGLVLLANLDGPLYAIDDATGTLTTLGAGLGGTPSAYLRGSALFAGSQYGLSNSDPRPGQADAGSQGLVTLDLATGSFALRALMPSHNCTHLIATPPGW
jgi:hypothetical protein